MDKDYEDDFWEYVLTLGLGIRRGGPLKENVQTAAPKSISHESV